VHAEECKKEKLELRMIVMGPPGAGKGTQTRRIAVVHAVPHVATGDMFRRHMRQGTPVGDQVRHDIEAGRLAPDDVACEILALRLAEPDCRPGFVLDGFPRSLAQARFLEELLTARGDSLSLVVNLEVSDEEIVGRLSARRICPNCGAIYNTRSRPPREDGICDAPGCARVALVQRRDDEEATIRERLLVYRDTTEPVLAFYEQLNKLHRVHGMDRDPQEVFEDIEAHIQAAAASCPP